MLVYDLWGVEGRPFGPVGYAKTAICYTTYYLFCEVKGSATVSELS
jgi:hypothetical protein